MTRSSTQENDESDGGSQQGMYFSNEAAVGNEADDNESDDENGAAGFQFTKKGKKTLKICRHFSYTLITNAASMGWEDGEIAALILLVAGQLEFDEAKLVRCLDKTETGSPNVISHIVDDGKFSFTVPQLVSILLSYAKNVDHFITIMGDACECDMFDLTDAETIDVLFSFVENNMDYRESQRYARQLCEHSPSKRICGKILLKFTTGMSAGEAAGFVCDIATLDFFQDILGSMKEFLRELAPLREEVEALLDETCHRDKDGEIVDSDADSEGNLRDFVTGDDVKSEDSYSDSDSEGSVGSDNTGDSDAGESGSEGNGHRGSGVEEDAAGTSEEEEEEVLRARSSLKHKHKAAHAQGHSFSGDQQRNGHRKRAVVVDDDDDDDSSTGSGAGSGAGSARDANRKGMDSSDGEDEFLDEEVARLAPKSEKSTSDTHAATKQVKRQLEPQDKSEIKIATHKRPRAGQIKLETPDEDDLEGDY